MSAVRAALAEMVGLMMTGEEPGAGSPWYQRAVAALGDAPVAAAPDAIGYVVEHDENGGNYFKSLGGYEGMKRKYGRRCRLVFAAAPAVQVQDERAAFEAWAIGSVNAEKLPMEKWDNGAYKDPRTYAAYYGWVSRAAQVEDAARALAAKPAEGAK